MNRFETVKRFYTRGLWDIERVRNAVVKGWITEEQFKELTGKAFAAEDEEGLV